MFILDNTKDILDGLDSKTLKSMCYFYKIRTKYRGKQQLVCIIYCHIAARIIQRNFRKRYMKYNICPITQEYLRYPFVSIRHPNGHFNYYSLTGIVSWFNKTKNFICPNTRYEISGTKVDEIDELYYYYYRKRIRRRSNTRHKKQPENDISFIGGHLINYIKNIQTIENLTVELIDNIIVPHIMSNLYYILTRNTEYSLIILCILITVTNNSSIKNKDYLLYRLKTIL